MAVIGTIRKNNWILIFAIGLGLAAFIMMDSMSGDRSIGATSGSTIGNIGGTKISNAEFERMYQIRSKNFESTDTYGQRASLWDYLVEKSLLQNESEELGLGVSTQELKDLQFGSPQNLSPLMAQRFPSPNSQPFAPQPDMQRINQFKDAIEKNEDLTPDFIDFWKMHEGEIRKDRLQTKLNNLVSKSMYSPSWMVEKSYAEQNQRIGFNYVKIPFDEVANSEVTVEDADLTAYLNNNIAKFAQDEETRKLGYVTFNVAPTAADSAAIKGDILKLGNDFASKTGEDVEIFVESNFGQMGQGWLAAEELNEAIQSSVFNQAVGTVTEPFLNGRAYQVAKILDRRILPDSAKSRHILLGDPTLQRGQQPREAQYVAWEKTADSLKTLLESGQANFDSLVTKFSTDRGSIANGGVYDYAPVNQYVPEFNDVVFFSGELNKLYAVRTDFGVHLIEPLGRKNLTNTERVKVAYLSKNVVPSRKTTKSRYTEATTFISNNKTLDAMKAAAEADPNLEFSTSNAVKANDYNVTGLGSTEDSRKMVKFAFENNVGDVSPNVYTFSDAVDFYDNKYVVAAVQTVQAAGKPSLDNIREEITPIVRNMKKGDVIKSKITAQNLSAIANTFQTQVDTASNVSFSMASVPGLGAEPKVIAAAFSLDQGGVSKPIIGDNGVYVVQSTSKPDFPAPSNIASIRKTVRQPSQSQVPNAMMQAMKKYADIDDNRSSFF